MTRCYVDCGMTCYICPLFDTTSNHYRSRPFVRCVVFLSGDVNFSPELNDLRFRCGFEVILIHGDQVSEALLATASRGFSFTQLINDIPQKTKAYVCDDVCVLVLYGPLGWCAPEAT